MNQSEWDGMSAKDKVAYLAAYEPKASSQACLNGNAKVGDSDAVFTAHTVTRGDVTTGAAKSLKEAVEQDEALLLALKKEAGLL